MPVIQVSDDEIKTLIWALELGWGEECSKLEEKLRNLPENDTVVVPRELLDRLTESSVAVYQDIYCNYCGHHQSVYPGHSDDCSWVAARNLLSKPIGEA